MSYRGALLASLQIREDTIQQANGEASINVRRFEEVYRSLINIKWHIIWIDFLSA